VTSGIIKWEKPEDLQRAIDEYLEETPQEEWTITGLALALDTSRVTLLDYQRKEEFGDIVLRAKLKIENAYELSLRKQGRSGDIFALKNFGWQDKQVREHEGGIEITEVRRTVVRPGSDASPDMSLGDE
jgi:hypothetical protein